MKGKMKQKLLQNKKGEFETALVDFYAALTIFVIVVAFFFLMQFGSGEVKFTLEEQEATYALDATRLLLVFTQSDVQTSLGTMSFGEFIGLAASDDALYEELDTLIDAYFVRDNVHLTAYGMNPDENYAPEVYIVIDVHGESKVIASSIRSTATYVAHAAFQTAFPFTSLLVSLDNPTIEYATLTVPLQEPGEYAIIAVKSHVVV
jgi:hypothetical protein